MSLPGNGLRGLTHKRLSKEGAVDLPLPSVSAFHQLSQLTRWLLVKAAIYSITCNRLLNAPLPQEGCWTQISQAPYQAVGSTWSRMPTTTKNLVAAHTTTGNHAQQHCELALSAQQGPSFASCKQQLYPHALLVVHINLHIVPLHIQPLD